MKYLKKFNEELKSQTYKSAARKLKKIVKDRPTIAKAIDAEERANKLEIYAKNIEEKEHINLWKKHLSEFSKYGEFNIELSRPGAPIIQPKVFSFHIVIISEIEMLIDSWDDEDADNRDIIFGFCIGLIPKTIEDVEYIKMNFNGDFYNGFFMSLWVYPTYTILNSEVTFKGVSTYDYDTSPKHQFADRKSVVNFKKLLVNIFDPTFDYPSGYNDITNMYDKIERDAIQGLEIAATYGIDMGRIKEDLQKTPIIDFYKQ